MRASDEDRSRFSEAHRAPLGFYQSPTLVLHVLTNHTKSKECFHFYNNNKKITPPPKKMVFSICFAACTQEARVSLLLPCVGVPASCMCCLEWGRQVTFGVWSPQKCFHLPQWQFFTLHHFSLRKDGHPLLSDCGGTQNPQMMKAWTSLKSGLGKPDFPGCDLSHRPIHACSLDFYRQPE